MKSTLLFAAAAAALSLAACQSGVSSEGTSPRKPSGPAIAAYDTLPTGAAAATNTIERQQFTTFGAEARVRLDWGNNQRHTFIGGTEFFGTDSPRTDSRGATSDATTGSVINKSQRDIFAAPVSCSAIRKSLAFRIPRMRLFFMRTIVGVGTPALGLCPTT